ncbi:hypothetical protein T03_6827 [Trichinella britovi]|uniref:Uncharacterized protein n=1 Tax=Trichinella britovi TaxID=45882 RepID=A0A0V1DJF7_TRIBR|nr:hypothetical protein T03_6827 [Trichinella britovi]
MRDKNNEEKKKYERGRHEAELGQYEVEQKKTASRCMRLAVGPNSLTNETLHLHHHSSKGGGGGGGRVYGA